MKTFFVDEKVIVWKRTRVTVEDDVTNEQFLDKLHQANDEAYCLDEVDNVFAVGDPEYLLETEDAYSGFDASVEVYSDNFELLYSDMPK